MTRYWRPSAPLLLLSLLALEACSADPARRHAWTTYERELIRLEAAGEHEQRIALADRGLADPVLCADDRATLQIEASLSMDALGRRDEALTRLDDAARVGATLLARERIELTRLRLAWDTERARRFLVQHPRAAAWEAVFHDWLRGLAKDERPARLHELLKDTREHPAATRCLVLYRYAQAALAGAPDAALESFDAVADMGCARSKDAACAALGELARQERWEELSRRGRESELPAVAWLACRLRTSRPDAEACLARFVERFPRSPKVDDAWWFQAEYRRAADDLVAARALLQRIVDERPDSGRAARAQRDLEALR